MADEASLYFGTCAWTFDDWNGVFYPKHLPPAERLGFYSKWFNAVEGDSTFYHVPAPHVVDHWAAATPDDFRFSLKVPREIIFVDTLPRNALGKVQHFLLRQQARGE